MSGFLVPGAVGPVAMAAASAAVYPGNLAIQPALWLKADAITGLSDGDAITTWTDSSGNGRNATQAGAATLKPTYKTGIINSLPVARFDGGDWLALPTGIFANGMSLSMFAAYTATDGAAYKVLIAHSYSYGSVQLVVMSSADGTNPRKMRFGIGQDPVGEVLSYSSVRADGTHIASAVFSDSANMQYLYLDGTLSDSDANTRSVGLNANDAPTVGAARNTANATASLFLGDISEIIAYDSALSDSNRQAVEAYLSAKYGIALA